MNDHLVAYSQRVIQKTSLSEQAFFYIKDLILSGQLRGGVKIPEEKIAQRLGVSRTPIREALKKLDQLGLVHLKPRSFAIVQELGVGESLNVAVVRLSLERLSVDLLVQSPFDLDFLPLYELQKECIDYTIHGELSKSFEWDSKIHIMLAQMTQNIHLLDLIERVDTKIQLLRLKQKVPKEELLKYVNQHYQLFQAIQERDPEQARKLIQTHILHDLQN